MELFQDKIKAEKATQFILDHLHKFNLSKLDSFKILPLTGKRHTRGFCRHPKRTAKGKRTFEHYYQITASAKVDAVFPYSSSWAIGTEQTDHPSVNGWFYLYEDVILNSLEEMVVFICGHEIFHFLRHSKQIEGRNSEPQANKYAIKLLEEFRKI